MRLHVSSSVHSGVWLMDRAKTGLQNAFFLDDIECSFREKSFWGIQGAIGSSGPCKYSLLRVCSTMTCLSHGCAPHNPAYIFDRCIASLLFSKFRVKFFQILIFGDVFSNSASH